MEAETVSLSKHKHREVPTVLGEGRVAKEDERQGRPQSASKKGTHAVGNNES